MFYCKKGWNFQVDQIYVVHLHGNSYTHSTEINNESKHGIVGIERIRVQVLKQERPLCALGKPIKLKLIIS